jgi:phytoene dehydrogenase-like protein
MRELARHVVIVGGGIAGLAASIYLARAGRIVTLFEKKPVLGGRAVTHLRHGFRFNLGPHSVYRFGPGARVARELGIPMRGGAPKRGGTLVIRGSKHELPVTPLSILMTSFLSWKAKVEAVRLMAHVAALNTRPFEMITIREWADRSINDANLRDLFLALCRVVTFSGDQQQSANVALEQLKLAMLGVIYVDEGWQKIVDSLHSHAVSAGVNFVTSSRVIRVDVDRRVKAIELGGLETDSQRDTLEMLLPPSNPGEERAVARIAVDSVVLAVDPMTAATLVSDPAVGAPWRSLQPITLSSLDVALSKLPNPKQTFAIGADKPYYFSVHSKWAQLTPHGGALLHVAKYRSDPYPNPVENWDGETVKLTDEARRDEAELESFLDELQPGWREFVVHKRFLPSLTVSNAVRTPHSYQAHPYTPIEGLYLAGDWVRSEGIMADSAFTSARAAAHAILANA